MTKRALGTQKGIIIPGTDKGVIEALIENHGFDLESIVKETGLTHDEINSICEENAYCTRQASFSLLSLYLTQYV